jgi:diguanylate cyclase (GGDEF)-like protein
VSRGLERVSGAGERGWYSPHRALIALGSILISIAIAGGLVGVVNATHAVRETATLSNRYLVLQPPVRTLRADVAVFQGLADSAFAGADATPTFLAKAVQASDATDRAYGTVRQLFDKLGDEGLEPHLAATMAAYVTARARLADYLSVGATSAQQAAIASSERTSDANLDNAIANSQAALTTRLEATAVQAQAAGNAAKIDLLLSLLVGGVLGIVFTSIFAWKALDVEREDNRNRAVRDRITLRNEFEGRLQRALEMAKSESSVYDLVSQALVDAAPDVRSELLLADSSRAHFRQVLVSTEATDGKGCGVVSPDDCPAATHGQTMVFPTSKAIDACPNLRGRTCSAACIPVSIGGNSIGVFHVTATDGSPPSDEVQQNVEVVGRRASERLAMLRAFDVSQSEANSDSLTGLMTRRSLERSVRDLQDDGELYSVAYGDLDHFKQINDVFGHDAGDRALRAFSQVLRDSLRPADIPCRFGGEEFVIVLPACRSEEAVQVLERVRTRLADRLATGQLPVFTVSFGLASSDQAADFQEVVDLADQALLRAKGGGRDRVIVASEENGLTVGPLSR